MYFLMLSDSHSLFLIGYSFFTTTMRVFRTIRLIWTFYKGFLFSSLLITACCLYYFRIYGFAVFAEVFWLKIVSLALTSYFINDYKDREFYYYQNAGISKLLLWFSVIFFDMAVFIILIILENKLR